MTDTNEETVVLLQSALSIANERIGALINERSGMIQTKQDQIAGFIKQIQDYQNQKKALDDQIKQLKRTNSDLFHLNEVYFKMLGPKGQAVATIWQKSNVSRVHFSWSEQGMTLMGEEAAQAILDIEQATLTTVEVDVSESQVADVITMDRSSNV